jgi:prepilin-type N-terminal cleavage/methylation domain-containing protein
MQHQIANRSRPPCPHPRRGRVITPPAALEQGFTLVEVIFALTVLVVGVLGSAQVLSYGLRNLSSSPSDVISFQKAAQAVESVYAARDSHTLKWSQIRNVNGAGGDGGVFLDGPQPLKQAGPDGLVNTADDAPLPVESMILPGPDQLINTADDEIVSLSGFRREISIRDVPNERGNLRSITVTITRQIGSDVRTHTLTTYISAFS